MDSTSSSRRATADNDERNPESSRYFVAGPSVDFTRPTSSSSYDSFRANEKELLPRLEATLNGRRRAVTKESPVLTRCYSDGKIRATLTAMRDAASIVEKGDDAFVTSSIAFDELLTARDDDVSVSRVCPTWMLHVEGDPTSPPPFVTTSSDNKTTSLRQSADNCVMVRPTTLNKRICSHQGNFVQSKTSATVSSCSWTPSLTQARKRSLGVSDTTHFGSTCPADKRASVPVKMNLESLSNAVAETLRSSPPSLSTPVIDELLPRGIASVPKRTCPFQQRRSRNPGNLSLDLSQMDQTASGRRTFTTMALQRLQDQVTLCSKVTDFLYIGGAVAAKNKPLLLQNGITHVINCAAGVAPASFPEDFSYYSIKLRDHSSQDIARHFYSMFDFIERAREGGGRIFLHCVKGISRSPTMAIAYLMWHKSIGMYKALDFVRQARSVVDPNAGFIFQLTEWEQQHPDGRLRFERTIVFRLDVMYAINSDKKNKCSGQKRVENNPLFVPLLGVDERHFRDPTKDVREQCLIVASCDDMFIWCGTDVSGDHVEVAESGAAMLQRYEAFPMKCERVRQGQEPAAFWDLVSVDVR
uniref:Protein-tyrosine-phosphatase n=1 Tax=Peronospora matthiolae TaxID=2874970 RepID=A0AAV1TY21_9STRA